jgi:hypothetical protein
MAAVEGDDGQVPCTVTEHIFTPPAGQPWERCVVCNLSEAAHLDTAEEYVPALSYRCPYCVDRGVVPCLHGRRDALDMKGERLP